MKSSLVRAALACLALALSATAGLAAPGDPVPGTEVGLEGDPESIVVAHGVTNDKGQITFGNVAPGKYRIVLDGKSLALALKKLDPKGLPATITIVVTVQPVGDSKPSELVARYQGPADTDMLIKLTVPAAPRGAASKFVGRVIFVGATIKF